MSDESGGPGWWMASDGKWYPPESKPDALPAHRSARPPPPSPPTPAAGEIPERSTERIVGLLAAGALVVGAFLPWVSVSTVFGTIDRSGIDAGGDGLVTLICGVVAGLGFFVREREWRVGALVASLIAAATGIYDMINVNDLVHDVDSRFVVADVGAGLWLTVVGAVASAAVATFMLQDRS